MQGWSTTGLYPVQHLSADVVPHSYTWVFTSANFQFANTAKLVMECLAGDNWGKGNLDLHPP